MLAARAPVLRQNFLRVRLAAPSRGVHGYEHIPFKHKNKPRFAIKVATFLLAGFTLPAFAAAYQISKST
ncbi:hypothetical protein OF83DRAFT_1097301 [Amylostereum chailletii]|nr:hypothetical protein OF83DRAFT_1097301 [Amylostereum chailletii]